MSSKTTITVSAARAARCTFGDQTECQPGRPRRRVIVDPEQLIGPRARTRIRPGHAMTPGGAVPEPVVIGIDVAKASLEASGGYEMPVVAVCTAAGLPVSVVNPRQVRAFAQAIGRTAKTDPIDALVLARFGARVEPPVRAIPDTTTQALAALVARRRQLLEMLGAEQRRLAQATTGPVRRDLRDHIRWLQRRVTDVDREIGGTVEQSPVWRVQ